jgi:hypothetical protein
VYELMLPYASLSVIVASAAGHFGVVSHSLGIAAAASGQLHAAERWFADALARYEAMSARPYVARVLVDRAMNLSAMNGASDPRACAAMLERARALAQEIGMPSCLERIDAIRSEASAPVAAAPPVDAHARDPRTDEYAMRLEGEYWSILFAGRIVRVRDTKGLRYLGELLRSPGRALHALELVAACGSLPRDGRVAYGSDVHGTGTTAWPLLDPRAKAEYRQRIGELYAEIAEAEGSADAVRASRCRAELEEVAGMLAAAAGLGGRSRRAGGLDERARVNVTRAIRKAIGAIRGSHPALGRHLAASVTTGRFCCYEPSPAERVDWAF